MLWIAVLGDREAVGVAVGDQEINDLGVPVVERCVCAPADNDEVRTLGEFYDAFVVLRPDGVGGLLEPLCAE